jgi:tellurite resistance protein TerC
VRLVTRYIPLTHNYEGEKFFTRVDGKLTGTLLLLVLLIVEVTDLVFAVDSIPAIFAITTNTFIVYTSNVFAILGLRSMYFLLAGVVEKFHYLKMGLAIVLTFIGSKMLIVAAGVHIPIWFSLVFVAVVLLSSVVASLVWAKHADMDIEVDLPEDFDSPFEDDDAELGQKLDQARVDELNAPLSRGEIGDEVDSHVDSHKEFQNSQRR